MYLTKFLMYVIICSERRICIANVGKIFEKSIQDSIPSDVYCERLKDPAQSFGGSSSTRFSLRNNCDFILYKKPSMYALELKTTSGTSIPFDKESNKCSGIKKNQIDGLTKMSRYGIVCGFILNFRKTTNTYFMGINEFNDFLNNTDKKSLNEKDIIAYNGILLIATKKRVRYTYDLSFLWNKEEGT